MGGRERRGKDNLGAKKKKREENIPGWRKGQGLPATSIQQSHSRTCQAARAKYRGREEPGPGRGRSASHPYSAEAGDTFHHLLSEKQQSSQAQRLLPGNLDYVATETTTSREPRLGKQSSRDKPLASCRPGPRSQEIHPAQDTTPGARWEERGRRGPGRRETKRERGGFRSTSFSLPLPLAGSGCPTLPKVLCWVTAGRG